MNDYDFMRYSRQISSRKIGESGQKAICSMNCLVIGAGGLGNVVAPILVGAGFNVTVCDGDSVELSNLHRQNHFLESDIGKNKAVVLSTKLKRLNSSTRIRTVDTFLEGERLDLEMSLCDIVIDCTDSSTSKLAINKSANNSGTPLVFGGVIGESGQVCCFDFGKKKTTCLQCCMGQPKSTNSNCSGMYVLAPIVYMVGARMASDVMKFALNGRFVFDREITFIYLDSSSHKLEIPLNEQCVCCGGTN